MHKTVTTCAAALLAALAASAVIGAEMEPPAYLDDRSTPEQLVRSYFNAIDRVEHTRAYSYFNPADAPAYDSWQVHFDDVVRTEVSFGQMAQEGAAGSNYYQLPVTVDFEHAEGQHHIERGCFSIRWINPANQAEPPFQPMHILTADLRPEGERQGFAAANCTGTN